MMPMQLAERFPERTVRAFVARLDCSAPCNAVRTQAAVLRSLLDEIERAGMERHAAQLREQIQEEARRLQELMTRESSREPPGARSEPA